MRTSRLNAAIGFLVIAPLMSALAACDEAQESTPITEVSPMGEAAVMPGAVPEDGLGDSGPPASEGPVGATGQDTRATRANATQGRPASPAPSAEATPATPAPQASETQTTPAADAHTGHGMQSADHHME